MPPSKLKSLYRLLAKVSPDNRPNLAILSENEFLFSYKDRLSFSEFIPGYGPVTGLSAVRGDVMDFFARLEFIVNQIFLAHLLNSKNEVSKFEELLDRIDFFSKIGLLKDWALIDNPMKERLICLKGVRNGFAHNWEIKTVQYKGKPIVGQFDQFKRDAGIVFSAVIKLYNGKEIDVDGLITELSAHDEHASGASGDGAGTRRHTRPQPTAPGATRRK